jgi:hypothetical protein
MTDADEQPVAPDAGESSLREAESLLRQLEEARAKLEATEDPDAAIEVMAELAQIAKKVEAAIAEAKRRADADA